MQLRGSKYFAHRLTPQPRDPGDGVIRQSSTFSEHGNDACQINENGT